MGADSLTATIQNPDSSRPSRVSILGACVNEGQDWFTGVEKAPEAFRKAGIVKVIEGLGYSVNDLGDVDLHSNEDPDAPRLSQEDRTGISGYIKNVSKLGSSCGELHKRIRDEAPQTDFMLTLGGDHSIAAGTISAMRQSKKDMAVVWVDAHADCNTPETSPSGNFHGMPVGLLLGWFKRLPHSSFEWILSYLENPLPERHFAFIGLRDVDEREKDLLRRSNILVYSMIDVERLGIARVMEEILEQISPNNSRPIHLSFDIDGMDPEIAPGTGTRAKGGLTYREGRYICTRLAETGSLCSMDLVEVNPTIDMFDELIRPDHGDNPNVVAKTSVTVKLGIDLIEFALGKTLT